MSLRSAAEAKELERVPPTDFGLVGELKAHEGRILNLCWASDSRHLMTIGEDGRIFIWDALEQTSVYKVSLLSGKVLAAGFSPGLKFVATGGLDNLISVYSVKDSVFKGARSDWDEKTGSVVRLSGHEGYTSSCEFWQDDRIVSTSGDGTAKMWDIPAEKSIAAFVGHSRDVMFSSGVPAKSLLLTASCDKTVKLWDSRTGECSTTFEGHTADVNSVRWFSNGFTFVTGSDDETCKVWDIRAGSCISTVEMANRSLTFCDVSLSGKYLFASHDDGKITVWSTLFGQLLQEVIVSPPPASKRLNCVRVSPDGRAFAAPSFDSVARVFA